MGLKLTRRGFTQGLLAFAASAVQASVQGKLYTPMLDQSEINKLIARVSDTILPADKYSPSATELGLDKALLKAMGKEVSVQIWPIEFSVWSNGYAHEKFGKGVLNIKDRQFRKLLSELEKSGSPLNTGFQFARNFLMEQFYSKEASWSGLSAYGAPQPKGYLDFFKPLNLLKNNKSSSVNL